MSSNPVYTTATLALDDDGTADAVIAWALTGLSSSEVVGGQLSGQVTIPAGQRNATISVGIVPERVAADEPVTLTITPVSGCKLGAVPAASFNVLHNVGVALPVVTLASGPGDVTPSQTGTVQADATVAATPAMAAAGSVAWTLTGLAGSDMVGGALTGTLPLPAGAATVPLPLRFAAQTLASDKAATLAISAPSGCTLGSPVAASFTLRHNNVVVTPPGWPYPRSALLPHGVSFDWTKFSLLAAGADNWVSTWTRDDRALAPCGDGGGFGGGRCSMILASITGTVAGALGGTNVVGGGNGTVKACFPNPAGSGYGNDTNKTGPCYGKGINAKSYGPLARGNDVWLWVEPGHVPGSYASAKLFHSTLSALGTWTAASWGFTNSTGWIGTHPTFMQAGKDYGDIFTETDGKQYFYTFSINWSPAQPQPATTEMVPGDIHLMRCPVTADPMTQSNWQHFTGTAAAPSWGAYASRQASWHDDGATGWVCSSFYDAALGRCVLIVGFGAWDSGHMGFYEAPRPWGPWGTIDRVHIVDPSNRAESSFFVASCLTRGLSVDGRSFPLLMSGGNTSDALVAVQASFPAS